MKRVIFFLKNLLMYGFFFFSTAFVSANFQIVEVMPNTTDDKNLEYITIQNTSSETLSLSGYVLSDKKKDFLFIGNISLDGGAKQQFFRPETKLVLNNSNEKLTLKNIAGEIVSEVEYASSTKGNFLSFEVVDTGNEEGIISEEALISGEVFISDEVSIPHPEPETGSTNSGGTMEVPELKVPEVHFGLQRPSYITQSGSTNIYICDNSKDECKVNFDLRPSFSDEFPERHYICKIDFGFGIITGQEQKCNPNTVIFPEGKHSVKMQIFHEDDSSIFSEKIIEVHNISVSLIHKSYSANSPKTYSNASSINKIHISYPRIIVQSGLKGEGRYFYCTKSECKINLNYEKRHKNERCLWKFGGGKPGSPTTYKRCNPGYVSYEPGTYKLYLEVYEKNNRSNRKVFRFFVYNEDTKEIEKDDAVIEVHSEDKRTISLGKQETKEISAHITLQGKQNKSQISEVSGVLCQGIEKCYFNFTASGFSDSQKYSYQWLNNGELFSEKYNPSGVWFEVGKHTIEFKVFQDDILLSSSTYVALVSKEELLISNTEKVSKTQINKEKRVKKNFTQNYLPLKYDGLRISGKAPIGSKVEVFLGEKLLGNTRVNQKGKYRMVTKNIGAGNHVFSTKIISSNGEKKIYENSGEYTLLQEKRAFWFISKKSRKRSSSKSQTRKNFLPELIISAHADESYERAIQETHLSPSQKILSYLLLAIALFGAILHMVFRQMEGVMRTSLVSLYNLRFSTKQRVNLLVG